MRGGRGSARSGPALLLALSCALACAGRPWDVSDLEQRYPELQALGSRVLGDITPYLLPWQGELTLFLCRWPTRDPIPVSLPLDAGPGEQSALEAALRAWEGAGLGIRFARGGASAAGIEIRFLEDAGEETKQTANTIADCAVDAAALAAGAREVMPARLVFASIHMRRSERDVLGRDVALSREELVGSALHELGHALGFQGHAQRGKTVMRASVDDVRRAGRRLLAGSAFEDAGLRALYAVPSGAVARRVSVSMTQTAPVDRMAQIARRRGLAGPFARVGDRMALIAWRDGAGEDYPLWILRLRQVLRSPERLAVHPHRRTAELLSAAPG